MIHLVGARWSGLIVFILDFLKGWLNMLKKLTLFKPQNGTGVLHAHLLLHLHLWTKVYPICPQMLKKVCCSSHSVPKIQRTIKLQLHSDKLRQQQKIPIDNGKYNWSIFQPTMLVQGCVARFSLKCCYLQLHNSRTRRRDFFLEGRCTKSVRSELYPPGN